MKKKLSKIILSVINNMKIRKKLISIYIVVGLIPFIFVSVFFSINMRKQVTAMAVSEAATNTERIKQRLNEVCTIATGVSDTLYLDDALKNIVLTKFKSEMDVYTAYLNYKTFDNNLMYYKQLSSIRLYVQNSTLSNNEQFITVDNSMKNSYWYKAALQNDGRITWQYVYDNISQENHLSLIRLFKFGTSSDWCVLVISINNDYLKAIIEEEPFKTLASINEDKIFMSMDSKDIGKNISRIGISKYTLDGDKSTKDVNFDGEDVKISYNTFVPEKTLNKFDVYTLIPVNNIVKDANSVSEVSFTIIFISLLISVGLILLFSKAFADRIHIFRKEIHRAVEGDFTTGNAISGNDEISEIYADLNIMMNSINQLINEVFTEKLKREQLSNRQKQVEFEMLASQINPHFLYNILETIRMKAHCNGQEEIASAVKTLAKILRRNLEVSSGLVELSSEIDMVKSYLYIQKFRFGDRVTYDIKVNCNIDNYRILPLLLQPVVENAFVHGLENKEENGKISIEIINRLEYMVILVRDNGIGITEEKLRNIYEKLNNFNSSSKKSIGLSNVNQRIKLFYGEKYGIKMKTQVNVGTEVGIYLPLNGEGVINVKSLNN